MNYCKVIIAGNLTRDPELRHTPSGTAVAKLGIAVNRRYTGKDGQTKEETTFVDVDCFGKTAENVAKYFTKGRSIFIEGRLKTDEWEDKQTGKRRTKLGVVMDSFQFADSKQSGNQERQTSQPSTATLPDDNDDVPF